MNAQHIIPKVIENEVMAALSYFPQLKDVPIEFKFKKEHQTINYAGSAKLWEFFKKRKHRSYKIFISEKFKITDKEFYTKHIPSDILIGWIGHELGHILDYQNRTNLNLIKFGFNYLTSDRHIVEAERTADTFAVMQGMSEYILKTKNFILNHADITQTYKDRMKRYYLSPEEIMLIVNEDEEAPILN